MAKWTTEDYRQYYYTRRQKIIDYLGGKCIVCGTTEKLEFDHIDPEKKLYNIKSRMSLKNNLDEINKCQLLCQDHHRDKTAIDNSGWAHGSMYGWQKMNCRCDICKPEWRAWHDKRNTARRK